MTRSGATRRYQAAQFEAAAASAEYVLRARGSDSMCGCPCACCGTCCTGSSVKCEFNTNFLPDPLNGVMSMEEYLTMIREIDDALQATLVPAFPCIFTHFCLPFSPICFMYHYASQRHKRIQAILEKYNVAMVQKGYYWESAPQTNVAYGFAFLRVNRTAATNYANNRGVVPVAVAAYGQAGMDRGNAAPHYEMTVATAMPAASAPVKMEY